jgi:hypothetical protein
MQPEGARVGTVDRFQGQEAAIMFSFARPKRAHAREARCSLARSAHAPHEMLGVRPMRFKAVKIATKS